MQDNPFLTPDQVECHVDVSEDKVWDAIEDSLAMAILAAPCLSDSAFVDPEDPESGVRVAQVRAVLREAVVRRLEGGTGAVTTRATGPFQITYDNKKPRRSLFWPAEVALLREICSAFTGEGRTKLAGSIDTAPTNGGAVHLDTCSIVFGAAYCSCGSSLNNGKGPIFP